MSWIATAVDMSWSFVLMNVNSIVFRAVSRSFRCLDAGSILIDNWYISSSHQDGISGTAWCLPSIRIINDYWFWTSIIRCFHLYIFAFHLIQILSTHLRILSQIMKERRLLAEQQAMREQNTDGKNAMDESTGTALLGASPSSFKKPTAAERIGYRKPR